MNFLQDLRRRRVFRLAGLYIVGAWIVIEVSSVFFPAWGIPGTALRYLFVAALLFPVALVFAWIFDITPTGIVRSRPASPAESADFALHRTDYAVLAALALVAVIVLFGSLERVVEEPPGLPTGIHVGRVANSVAVLPFKNLDARQDTAYFSDGVTEEILHRLSTLRQLQVLASTSSFAFRRSEESSTDSSAKLGVEYLLHGSVRRDADLVRVTARLLNQTGEQVWSRSYTRARSEGWQEKAEAAFRRAIELDPSYPVTCNWLSAAYQFLGGHDAEFEAILQQGYAIDPLSPTLVLNLAAHYARSGDFERAERMELRLTQLTEPPWMVGYSLWSLYTDWGRFADALQYAGDFRQGHMLNYAALGMMTRANTMLADNADEDPFVWFGMGATVLGIQGRYQEALKRILQTLDMYGESLDTISPSDKALAMIAKLRDLAGDTEGAYEALRQAVGLGWADYYGATNDPRWRDALSQPRFVKLLEVVQANLARQRAAVEAREAGAG